MAQSSEVSGIAVDQTTARDLNSMFRSEAHQWLLFLQNVASIELSEIADGGSAPELVRLAHVELRGDIPRAPPPQEPAEEATEEEEETAEEAAAEGAGADAPSQEGPAQAEPARPGEGPGGEAAAEQAPRPRPKTKALAKTAPSHDAPEAGLKPREAVLGSGGEVLANVVVAATMASFAGAPQHQTLYRYRLMGRRGGNPAEQVSVAVPLQVPPQDPLDRIGAPPPREPALTRLALGQEDGRLFCFLPLPRSGVSLRL